MPNAQTKNVREVNDKIGDQGGYFDLVVKPILQQGHEGELCSWLKEMSLIRSLVSCSNVNCNAKNLTWSPARIVDKYTWICSSCNGKKSIRTDSFFSNIKCDLKHSLQIILAWCQQIEIDSVRSYTGLKEHHIKKIYENCAKITEMYIESHEDEWSLGGPDKVVIVDEFPGGYMSSNVQDITVSKKRNNNAQNILCLAEAGAIPPKMWFHVLRPFHEPVKANKIEKIQVRGEVVEEALQETVKHVMLGSCIVANNKARCCNYNTLMELNGKGYQVVSVEYLQHYDALGTTEILRDLETIWQTGVGVCEDVQEATQAMSKQIISSHLWRKKFCSTPSMAFQYMLNHISEFYKFT